MARWTSRLRAIDVPGYDMLRVVLGSILLVAAALKTHQLATEPTLETSLLTSRWFLICVVEFELFFGLWLLAGLYSRWTRRGAVLCFSTFACISLYKALSGEATCGCFGRVGVNPWYTFALDAAAVAALSRCQATSSLSPLRPAEPGPHVLWLRLAVLLALWLPAAVPSALAMASFGTARLRDVGEVLGDGEVVVLKPETWLGKRLPLLYYIDVGDRLKEGKWFVLLYRYGCARCKEAIRDLPRLASTLGVQQAAWIELPPYENSAGVPGSPGMTLVHGHLSNTLQWFAETPILLTLDRGQVVAVMGG